MMAIGLVAAGALGHYARAFQRENTRAVAASGGEANLGKLDSYALTLLLGGLRGPLVMVLWINSESQKIDRNLEGVDSQIEWIRLLQPEFDTVHLFQIWNKAYNISVQMVGLANKYATILDALDYGRNVLEERPTNINLLTEVARVNSHKLGDSAEKEYYRRRVRQETLPPIRATFPANQTDAFHKALADVGEDDGSVRIEPDSGGATASAVLTAMQARKLEFRLSNQPPFTTASATPLNSFAADGVTFKNVADEITKKGQPGWRRLRMDVMLNERGELLPQYAGEFTHIGPLGPFPYGLSPFALAYDYAKRAQVVWRETGVQPKQVSDAVVDSRPGLELKAWAEEELMLARRQELTAYNEPVPIDRFASEIPTAGIRPDQPIPQPFSVPAALYGYAQCAKLTKAALDDYAMHVNDARFVGRRLTYQSHLDHLDGLSKLSSGDHDYLMAFTAPADRPALLAKARAEYVAAWDRFQRIILLYYVDEELLKQIHPAGRDALLNMTDPAERWKLVEAISNQIADAYRAADAYADDRNEYLSYCRRIVTRLGVLNGLGMTAERPTPATVN